MALYSIEFSYEQESNDRNYIITSLHNNIPSYTLWEDHYIKQQNVRERLNWWTTLNIPECKKIENELKKKWINYLIQFKNQNSKFS